MMDFARGFRPLSPTHPWALVHSLLPVRSKPRMVQAKIRKLLAGPLMVQVGIPLSYVFEPGWTQRFCNHSMMADFYVIVAEVGG